MGLAVLEGGKVGKKTPDIGSEEWAKNVRAESKELALSIDANYLKLARNLWLLFDTPKNNDPKQTNWMVQWGYGHIGEYAEKELGLNPKTAERLRRIWFVLRHELKDVMTDEMEQRILRLGRSRMRELTRPGVLNAKNLESWVKKAEDYTYLTLLGEIRMFISGRTDVMAGVLGPIEPTSPDGEVEEADDDELKPISNKVTVAQVAYDTATKAVYEAAGKSVPEAPEVLHHKNFALYKDQYDTLTAALERAAELSGSKKDGQNLSLIALDFLATNEFKKASMEQVQRFLIRIEKALNIKLIAVTPKDHEMLFGFKVLDRILNKEDK